MIITITNTENVHALTARAIQSEFGVPCSAAVYAEPPHFNVVTDASLATDIAAFAESFDLAAAIAAGSQSTPLDPNLLAMYTVVWRSVGKDWSTVSHDADGYKFTRAETRQMLRDAVRLSPDPNDTVGKYMDFDDSNKILPSIRELIPPEYLVELA